MAIKCIILITIIRCCGYLLAIHLLLSGLAFASENRFYKSGDSVYTGAISAENNKEFFRSNHKKKIKRLIITSSGGDVEAGIELGRWVFTQQLDVIVEDYCLSSCANYVFTAGLNKWIRPGAVVAWHGNYRHLLLFGAWNDEVDRRMQSYHESMEKARRFVKKQVDRLVQLEERFFNMIGVDESICWIGKEAPFAVSDYYFLSIEDMARFGVKQVQASNDYVKTDISALSVSVIYIKLLENNRSDK